VPVAASGSDLAVLAGIAASRGARFAVCHKECGYGRGRAKAGPRLGESEGRIVGVAPKPVRYTPLLSLEGAREFRG
jgi:hypothetical protein